MNQLTQFEKNIQWLTENMVGESADIKRTFHVNSIKLIYDKYSREGFAIGEILDFFHLAQLSGADPRKKEVYLVGFKGNCQIVYSYHFLLGQANKTGKLKGVTCTCDIEEVYNPISKELNKELVATAKIFREENSEPSVFKAVWSEFVKTKRNGEVTKAWAGKPRVMLQKCAISNALRWAFPEALSGVFIEDEMPELEQKKEEKTFEDITTTICEDNKAPLSIEVTDATTQTIQADTIIKRPDIFIEPEKEMIVDAPICEEQKVKEVKNATFRLD